MTNRLQRLEQRGLVTRSQHPDDARLGVVQLIEAGRKLVDAAVADHVATLDRMLAGVPTVGRAALAKALTAVERTAAEG